MEVLTPDDPNVFVCREGHITKKVDGYTKLTCRKLVANKKCHKPAQKMHGDAIEKVWLRGYRLGAL